MTVSHTQGIGGCGVPLTIQVWSNASGCVDIISHDAGARVSGYLAHPKLHGQIEAGAEQPPSVAGQAGSHISGRMCHLACLTTVETRGSWLGSQIREHSPVATLPKCASSAGASRPLNLE